MKSNIDLYKNVSDFRENFKISQKTEMKLTEINMMLRNFEDELKQFKIIVMDEMEKTAKHQAEEALQDATVKINECLKLDAFEQHNTENELKTKHTENTLQKIFEELAGINKRLEEDYINGEDLEKYNHTVQNTFQQMIAEFNLATTPKIQSDFEVYNLKIQDIARKLDVIFDKIKLLTSRVEELETKPQYTEVSKVAVEQELYKPVETQAINTITVTDPKIGRKKSITPKLELKRVMK